MLSIYPGEFLVHPVPLELSLNRCNYGCVYCFSTLNYRRTGFTSPPWTHVLSFLKRFRSRRSLEARLLQAGYPVLLSNHTDPFCPANQHVILPLLTLMVAQRIPVAFQTRGGKLVDDALSIIPPSCWYVTFTIQDPDLQERLEPGSPGPDEKLYLIDRLVAAGQHVSVGINPYVPAWIPRPGDLLRELKARGVHGVWLQHLHLNYQQRNRMSAAARQTLGTPLLKKAMQRVVSPTWWQECDAFRDMASTEGLDVFQAGQYQYSEYFTPYYTIYKRCFPTLQEWINTLHRQERTIFEVIPRQEFLDYCLPYLLPGKFSSMSQYLGAVAIDVVRQHHIPATMSYAHLLALLWQFPTVATSPLQNNAFGLPAQWDDTIQGWRQFVHPDGSWLYIFNDLGMQNAFYYDIPPALLTLLSS